MLRIDILPSPLGSQARPSEGPKLFRSLSNQRSLPPFPTLSKESVVEWSTKSRSLGKNMMPFTSKGGARYSQRRPYFNVRRGRTFQSSSQDTSDSRTRRPRSDTLPSG